MTLEASTIPHEIPYDPAEIVLLGYWLDKGSAKNVGRIALSMKIPEEIVLTLEGQGSNQFCIGLIKSYIYENQRYDLPRPKLMVLPDDGTPVGPANESEEWKQQRFWRVKKLDQTTEISIESGMFEELVLAANLPGRRSPNSYAANMQLGHRSGKMTT
ncbi:MAG: hypothetical protein AAF414_13190 [Pseudomonadota bacterium]